MAWLTTDAWDLEALTARWRAALPFEHLVIEGAVDEPHLGRLRQAVAGEPHFLNGSPFYQMMASSTELTQPDLKAFAAEMSGPSALGLMTRLSGHALGRVEVRSYIYLANSYLLPHTDYGTGMDRRIAWVLYLTGAERCEGGELLLYDCDLGEGPLITATRPGPAIAPRAGRLVLMNVSTRSLHEVKEVTAGARVSLAGWFFAP